MNFKPINRSKEIMKDAKPLIVPQEDMDRMNRNLEVCRREFIQKNAASVRSAQAAGKFK